MVQKLMEVTRDMFQQAYEDADRPFIASTRVLESTLPLVLTAVDNEASGTTRRGVLVARAGQTLPFFSYAKDGVVPGLNVQALPDDTNLQIARRTNAQEDFAMEEFSLTMRSLTVEYGASVAPTYTDADAIAATRGGGTAVIFDPTSIAVPAVLQSSLMNENVIMAAVQPHLTLSLSWDKRSENIGAADLIPCGNAQSFMRATGKNSPEGRYRFREGFAWRNSGADSSFLALMTLARSVSIPYTQLLVQGGTAPATAPLTRVVAHLKFRVHGISFGYGSRN